jgi:hypothetical protein
LNVLQSSGDTEPERQQDSHQAPKKSVADAAPDIAVVEKRTSNTAFKFVFNHPTVVFVEDANNSDSRALVLRMLLDLHWKISPEHDGDYTRQNIACTIQELESFVSLRASCLDGEGRLAVLSPVSMICNCNLFGPADEALETACQITPSRTVMVELDPVFAELSYQHFLVIAGILDGWYDDNSLGETPGESSQSADVATDGADFDLEDDELETNEFDVTFNDTRLGIQVVTINEVTVVSQVRSDHIRTVVCERDLKHLPRVNDVIVAANGQNIEKLEHDQRLRLILRAGVPVTLRFRRPNAPFSNNFELSCKKMQAVLIDDFAGRNMPLLKLEAIEVSVTGNHTSVSTVEQRELHKPSQNAEDGLLQTCESASDMCCEMLVKADWYNANGAEWEPLVEPWRLAMDMHQKVQVAIPSDITQLHLTLDAKSPVNINIADSMLCRFCATFTDWMQLESRRAKTQQPVALSLINFSPYKLANNTGLVFSYWVNNGSSEQHSRHEVQPGQVETLQLEQGVVQQALRRSEMLVHGVDIQLDGPYGRLENLPAQQAGSYIRDLPIKDDEGETVSWIQVHQD